MTIGGGATLVMPEPEDTLPGRPLVRTLRDAKISVLTMPPSSLAATPVAPLLRILNLAGEAASPALVAHWLQGRRLFNLYGPTEGTIWATVGERRWRRRRPDRPPDRRRVRSRLGQCAPASSPGVPGELHIGGVGVARGYLNRSDLNAARFVPDMSVASTRGAVVCHRRSGAVPVGRESRIPRPDRRSVKCAGSVSSLPRSRRSLSSIPLSRGRRHCARRSARRHAADSLRRPQPRRSPRI